MQINTSSPVPVYLQVEQLIEQLIVKQGLSQDELLPGVSVLAKQLGIAPLTVQKAYRRLQERGLIYSIAGKGTFVADASKQQFVGVLVHNEFMLETPQAPTLALLIQAMCDHLAASRTPFRILTDTNPWLRRLSTVSADVMSAMEHGRPLGMILLGHFGSDALFSLAREKSFPVVGFSVNSPQVNVRVNFDHQSIIKASLRYMHERGITEPALMWLDQRNSPAERLAYLKSIERTAAGLGLKMNPDWIIGVHQANDWAGYHAFTHLCSLPRRPKGLIVLDDVIGRGVHMGVLARQIRVPEDLLLVVQTNEDSPIVFPQQWQQCGYNLRDCGKLTVDALHALMEGKKVKADLKCHSKWHGESVRSPWNNTNVTISRHGHVGPLFQSGRQLLETAR